MTTSESFKVLIADKIASEGIDLVQTVADVDIVLEQSEDELCKIIENYDELIVRSATQVSDVVINAGKKLKVIGRAGTGVDNIA